MLSLCHLLGIPFIQESKVQPTDGLEIFQAQVLKYVLFEYDRIWDLFLADLDDMSWSF